MQSCCDSNRESRRRRKESPPRAAEKAHAVCRPGRDKLSAKRKVSKGFSFVSGKLLFEWADSRFGEPRISFWEGFNFVSAKPPLRRAESRFAEPRCSLQRERVYSFRLYEKNGEYPRGLRTSGLRGRFKSPLDTEFYPK